MKKILAFAGSNSSLSINRKLLDFAVSQINGFEVKTINLIDYELPMFGEDIEREKGYNIELRLLNKEVEMADALIIAVNEHNGMVSAYFKNILDWLSRLDRNFLDGKKIMLMSTSRGKRGAASSLEYTKNILPRFGGTVVESFSLPQFDENFSEAGTISKEIFLLGFIDVLQNFLHQVEL